MAQQTDSGYSCRCSTGTCCSAGAYLCTGVSYNVEVHGEGGLGVQLPLSSIQVVQAGPGCVGALHLYIGDPPTTTSSLQGRTVTISTYCTSQFNEELSRIICIK